MFTQKEISLTEYPKNRVVLPQLLREPGPSKESASQEESVGCTVLGGASRMDAIYTVSAQNADWPLYPSRVIFFFKRVSRYMSERQRGGRREREKERERKRARQKIKYRMCMFSKVFAFFPPLPPGFPDGVLFWTHVAAPTIFFAIFRVFCVCLCVFLLMLVSCRNRAGLWTRERDNLWSRGE